jgi:CRISPR-associated protein Csd2
MSNLPRYDFVYFFDVVDGNPNGDPDAGNLPRVDAETGHGLVTDVCIKRKIRNYVGLRHGEQPPYEIYVKEKAVLNKQHRRAYEQLKLKPESKKLPRDEAKARELTAWMCVNFFDVRAFGAVMTTEVNCGQVRGPLQFTTSRSVAPVVTLEHTITRVAVTNEKDAETKDREMGRKFAVPYGLYRMHGYLNPVLAEQTGFGEADLRLLKDALNSMFEADRSAARGLMAPVKCWAFRHESPLGNARADQLFVRASVRQKDPSAPARSRDAFELSIDRADLPSGVTIEEWVA